MIRPATLMPIPVHKIANSRGKRDSTRISSASQFPFSTSDTLKLTTPINSESTEQRTRTAARSSVLLTR